MTGWSFGQHRHKTRRFCAAGGTTAASWRMPASRRGWHHCPGSGRAAASGRFFPQAAFVRAGLPCRRGRVAYGRGTGHGRNWHQVVRAVCARPWPWNTVSAQAAALFVRPGRLSPCHIDHSGGKPARKACVRETGVCANGGVFISNKADAAGVRSAGIPAEKRNICRFMGTGVLTPVPFSYP